MKYLKRFNEELKSSTYISASRKLAKIGHNDRAKELKEWGIKTERKEDMVKWEERIQKYSPFGTYKLSIVNPKTNEKLIADFYLDISFDELSFEDTFESSKNEDGSVEDVGIPLFIGIIPTSEETIKKCDELMPTAEFGNGMYWGMVLSLDFDIKGDKVEFKKFYLDNYDETLSGNISFADRASAGKFKTLLKNIFSNSELNYPSGYNDVEYMYQKLEQVICIQQSFSSDYGFELKNVADFINQQSPNTMYKNI